MRISPPRPHSLPPISSHFLRPSLCRELSLQKGDVVYIHRQVDANWYDGEHHGRAGIFPTSYVEVCPTSQNKPDDSHVFVCFLFLFLFFSFLFFGSSLERSVVLFPPQPHPFLPLPPPHQIIPPSEKPTPIRAPTVQVLEYGEAVALYSFTADLPVELSFKKVTVAFSCNL